MSDYREYLQFQLELLNKIEKKNRSNLDKLCFSPIVSIQSTSSNGCCQFTYRSKNSTKKTYIRKDDHKKIIPIIQKEYEEDLAATIKKNKKSLITFLNSYDENCIKNAFNNLGKGRQMLVTPIISTDEQYICSWHEAHKGGQNTYIEGCKYKTALGETVRSKSEMILANIFYNSGIPYEYEPKLILPNGKIKYPDFALLNVRERKTCYWEHLGLITDENYAINNFKKIADYEKNGLVVGDNLIISLETPEAPLDIRLVKNKIRMMLM